MEDFFKELWMILVESSLWLLLGFAIAGAIHALVPRQWMLKHLSGGGFWPIAKASMLGIPLPLCSCSVIPVAAGLRKQGASKGASAAFAISTPQTGEESIPITWALFGPVYAFTRPIVAVITALIAGLLIDTTGKKDTPETLSDEHEHDPGAVSLSITNADDADKAVAKVDSCCSSTPKAEPKSCCSSNPAPGASCCSSPAPVPAPESGSGSGADSCCASTPAPTHTSLTEKFKIGFKHGFGTMVLDLVGWLSVGLILAAIIGAAVPQDWIAQHIGTGILPKLIMLLVGIPLYICATSSTPLAWSLVAAGLSPGAALVMLLSGPATNVATMSWLIKDLGVRALVIYLGVIAAVALAAGILFDAFFTRFVHIANAADIHDHASLLQKVAAVLFIMLMAWAMGMKMRSYMNKKGWGTTNPAPAGASCCSSGAGKPGSSCGCH